MICLFFVYSGTTIIVINNIIALIITLHPPHLCRLAVFSIKPTFSLLLFAFACFTGLEEEPWTIPSCSDDRSRAILPVSRLPWNE